MDITSLEQRAIDFARRGDFGADARQVNEELTKLAPANQGAWTRLARCNIELGLLDEANAALETVLQLNPQNTIARSLLQESIRRAVRLETPVPQPKARRTSRAASTRPAKRERSAPVRGGIGRAQFAALGQLAGPSAVESLTPSVEPLLVALNDRPFAEKVVESRNRAGHAGNVLFRRNSLQAGADGHVYAFHHGGRREPQINVGFYAAQQWGRHAIRAGLGFYVRPGGDSDTGQERAIEYFETFQRLLASRWKPLLTGWMSDNGGFIQYGAGAPQTDLLPEDAVAWLTGVSNPVEHGWIFAGRWLFHDRAADAAVIEDPARLTKWMEQSFVDLLPLWTSVYRGE